MRAIIFGDPNSIHTYMNLKEVMLNSFSEIYLIHYNEIKNDEYANFYIQNNIKSVRLDYLVSSKAKRFIKLAQNIIKIKKLGKFDLCVVHFLNANVCKFVAQTSKNYNKILAVYWGSDLLRMNEWHKKCQVKLLDKADYIVAGELYPEEVFNKIFENKYKDKLVKLHFFVNDNFKEEIKESRIEICEKLKLDAQKTVVLCGYNGSKAQNHEQLISQIDKLNEELKQQIEVVCFMTYSEMQKDEFDKYKKEISAILQEKTYKSIILTEYLSKHEMLELAKVVDVFLHFIKSDGFSGSLIEMMAGGAYVIKGEWLKYYEFNNCIMESTDFEHLSERLSNAIVNIKGLKEKTKINKDIVVELIDNERFKKEWLDFIKEAV